MTRINIGIPPENLIDSHLLAEHREITRIPNMLKKNPHKVYNIPKEFCLGTGHMLFFLNKLGYLQFRYYGLFHECCKRGFNVTNKANAFLDISPEHYGKYFKNYSPTETDIALIKDRIKTRIKESKGPIRFQGLHFDRLAAQYLLDRDFK